MDCLTGMKADWSHGQLHTIVITDANHFTRDQRLARDILFCLGYTIGQARRQYGVSEQTDMLLFDFLKIWFFEAIWLAVLAS